MKFLQSVRDARYTLEKELRRLRQEGAEVVTGKDGFLYIYAERRKINEIPIDYSCKYRF